MPICLFEDDQVTHLLPLTYTRAVYDLRLGIRTLLETTADAFAPPLFLHARSLVADVMRHEYELPVNSLPEGVDVLFVNGRYVATDGPVLERLRRAANDGEPGRVFTQGDDVVAAWVPEASSDLVETEAITRATFDGLPEEQVDGAQLIGRLWHLIDDVHVALHRDFRARLRHVHILDRSNIDVHERATLLGGEQIYLGPRCTIRPGAILNAEDGPIYIDEHATVMEHAVIRGPAYVGPQAQVKVGANVEDSAVGAWCKVGGEVQGSILHSYSNKAHAGYLGDSYLGRWCNLGADTNTSNLKNDYGIVTLYNAATGTFESSGQQFLGLVMGDHAKCGIDTMFNTGTVVGVFCNIYGAGFPPRYIPSFSWGSPEGGFVKYRLEKALDVAETVMARRNCACTDADRALLRKVFAETRSRREIAR